MTRKVKNDRIKKERGKDMIGEFPNCQICGKEIHYSERSVVVLRDGTDKNRSNFKSNITYDVVCIDCFTKISNLVEDLKVK